MLLYEGDATLSKVDGDAHGLAVLRFSWLPSTRVTFDLEDVEIRPTMLTGSPTSIRLHDEDDAVIDVRLTTFQIGASSRVAGVCLPTTLGGGKRGKTDRVTFILPNWPQMLGGILDDGAGNMWAGRVTLEGGGWRCHLDARFDLRAVTDRLRADGGFAATHIGELRRIDGKAFSMAKAREFARALRYYLAFARGFWTPPLLATGFRHDGAVWREWSGLSVDPWRCNRTWFNLHNPEPLINAFPAFMSRWLNPEWRESLELAISWLVEANPSDPAESSVILGKVALELLGWMILVEDEKVTSAKTWDSGRNRAERHIASLLDRLQIDRAIPKQDRALRALAAREGWQDAARAIVGFRNKLVHPRHRAGDILEMPVMARVELAELVSSYIELALLYFCGYRGEYLDASTRQMHVVPWA